MDTTSLHIDHQKNPVVSTHPLSTIYFYLTDGCNLRCRHCWIEPDYEPEGRSCQFLPLETFKSIVTQAMPLGLTTVKLTGGEPLLHPQIREIIDFVRSEDLRLNIETNGILCTPEIAGQIVAGKGPFVSVSIDAADAPTHEWLRGVDGCFDDTIRGFKNLVEVGMRPQLIMTLHKRNYGQIESVVRMAESLGAGSVKFNVLQPTARGKQMHEAGEALSVEELIHLGSYVEKELSSSTKLNLHFSQPPAFRPLSRMFGSTGTGCSVCGILGIIGVLADGSYAMCGIGETIPELIFGSAAKDRLEDVWVQAPVLRELREGMPKRLEGICHDCGMNAICKGNCLAQNYARKKKLWAANWYCDEASKRGLFPETRTMVKREGSASQEHGLQPGY